MKKCSGFYTKEKPYHVQTLLWSNKTAHIPVNIVEIGITDKRKHIYIKIQARDKHDELLYPGIRRITPAKAKEYPIKEFNNKRGFFCKFHQIPPEDFELMPGNNRIYITYMGKTQSLAKWSREFRINYETLRRRYHAGQKDEYLFRPMRGQ